MQRVAAALHLEMKFPRKHFPLPSADCRLCSEAGPAQLHVFFSKSCAWEVSAIYAMNGTVKVSHNFRIISFCRCYYNV